MTECLRTELTMVQLDIIRIQLLMPAHVHLQCFPLCKTLLAVLTLERFLARMSHQVAEQNLLLRKGTMTDVAAKWLLACK